MPHHENAVLGASLPLNMVMASRSLTARRHCAPNADDQLHWPDQHLHSSSLHLGQGFRHSSNASHMLHPLECLAQTLYSSWQTCRKHINPSQLDMNSTLAKFSIAPLETKGKQLQAWPFQLSACAFLCRLICTLHGNCAASRCSNTKQLQVEVSHCAFCLRERPCWVNSQSVHSSCLVS